MSYRIFTDATADLTEEILKGLPPVEIIPMNVNLGEQDYLFGPGGNLTVEEFYRQQRDGKFASTSQITPETYREHFEPVLEGGEDVVYLCFSSGLSDTINGARLCAGELADKYPDRRLVVVDTLCAAIGEGFIVHEAAGKQAEGFTLDELVAWVEAHKLEVCHWFTVDTFEHLRRGGRVSAASAVMGTALNIKPLLHVDEEGKLKVMGKPRGRKKAMAMQLDHIREGLKPELGQYVLIGHGDCQDVADDMKAQILALYPEAEIQTGFIGPVIGAHTGPGMLAIIYWGTNR